MTRQDWLTLFIALEGAPDGLDPVRIQNGMFLFAMEASVPEEQTYGFRPYNYGPMSRGIYDDLDRLVSEGTITATPVEGQSWARYVVTALGVERARRLLSVALALDRDAVQHLYDNKHAVASMTFRELLEDVYARYPDYAANSIFRRSA